MTPAPGARWQRFVGDRVRFTLRDPSGRARRGDWRARLRTNLGRAQQLRREIIGAHTQGLVLAGASWRDLPMSEENGEWSLELPLTEVGYFKAKAYLLNPQGWQQWPEGPDVGIAVHPDRYRTGNTIYCAFTRMFGASRTLENTRNEKLEPTLRSLDDEAYTVIPPSGKLRDLIRALPHIFNTLGFRILHLLPVNPTPTTYARFGRYGSPYAALDLTAIDPALVVFDRRATGLDQFRELTYQAHLLGGRVFLDIVINHTGWGSVLQEQQPQWFLRHPDGTFASPGAWGTTWEDLVEMKHDNAALWDVLAEMFLTWCRRGVDGFRCDAGYKVKMAAWQYIVARVQEEYPETIFLLEGLGGAWELTDALLTEGGMQWAYSELFQNYSGTQVNGYLDHSLKQSQRVGLLVHYSETHDNERLAARGRAWSLLRNRLCGLASVSGGFGITCGVEWLAKERIAVHGSSGLAWDAPANIVPELSRLNRLLAEHPCFFDGASLTRLSAPESPVYALLRQSKSGEDVVLVLVNTELERPGALELDLSAEPGQSASAPGQSAALEKWVDLLGQTAPGVMPRGRKWAVSMPPGSAFCLAPAAAPQGLHGAAYRRERAQAAWGLAALSALFSAEKIGAFDWRRLAQRVDASPGLFLNLISRLAQESEPVSEDALDRLSDGEPFASVVNWSLGDARRVTPVPPGHWLLLQDPVPFRAALAGKGQSVQNVESLPVADGHVACFAPGQATGDAALSLERYASENQHLQATLHFLEPEPRVPIAVGQLPRPTDLVLLTNGRGGMARLCVDLGRVLSKYDCVLGANLHPEIPVDRHILAKRIRVWVNADGFISPLDHRCLAGFEPGSPAVWRFIANAGDGRTVEIRVAASMPAGRNTTVFQFSRPTAALAAGKQLPSEADVRLTVRLDIEDRNFHSETKHNGGADYHFTIHTHPLPASESRARAIAADQNPNLAPAQAAQFIGFAFTPAADRQLRAFADGGCYHPQPEWSDNLQHPVEQSRGQEGAGDAFSPGWFDLPLPKGGRVKLVVTAEKTEFEGSQEKGVAVPPGVTQPAAGEDAFTTLLRTAIAAFIVRRGSGRTVIAGYPWFLDWGRDTFICARGLIAAGLVAEVKDLLATFARFEKDGTLPNTIMGQDASNRDTTDAPLWFGLVHEELASFTDPGPALVGTVESIARNYIKGTPNGIRMDPASALIWSPSHFTWMDTNYPACTPREGYPVEIQALWVRLLRQLARVGSPGLRQQWGDLALQASASLERLFWLEDRGYFADVLRAPPGQPASGASADDALRSNCLFAVSLGVCSGPRARRCVEAARGYLPVPGALRSLAPLPVSAPLPIYGADGRLLNNPTAPYWGRYEGDEDTRRKPAYHNGTAWTWTLPVFCEALARAWIFSPEAVAAARAYLGSMAELMGSGCLGQLPELLDGDAPHTPRGCDAQAWAATEALRVWKLLRATRPAPP